MMRTSKVGYVKVGFVIALVVFVSTYAWLHMRFPVYNERQVTNTIERNIPIGTSRVQIVKFLNTLKKQDVYYEVSNTEVGAYFPETMLYFRGWRCVAAYFRFKNGKMAGYEVRRVSI
jgi:hypothetical protein